MVRAGSRFSVTTWAVCTNTKEPGDGSAQTGHRTCPTRRDGGSKATEAPLNRGFFATRSLTKKCVPLCNGRGRLWLWRLRRASGPGPSTMLALARAAQSKKWLRHTVIAFSYRRYIAAYPPMTTSRKTARPFSATPASSASKASSRSAWACPIAPAAHGTGSRARTQSTRR